MSLAWTRRWWNRQVWRHVRRCVRPRVGVAVRGGHFVVDLRDRKLGRMLYEGLDHEPELAGLVAKLDLGGAGGAREARGGGGRAARPSPPEQRAEGLGAGVHGDDPPTTAAARPSTAGAGRRSTAAAARSPARRRRPSAKRTGSTRSRS